MKKIERDGKVYGLHSSIEDAIKENSTEWFGNQNESLQGSKMFYNKGKTFRTHKHILNPRIINYTQEAFVVIKGAIKITIYDDHPQNDSMIVNINDKSYYEIGSLTAKAGDVIFIWKGFHKLEITKDKTIVYEIKAGRFISVEEDKEFME